MVIDRCRRDVSRLEKPERLDDMSHKYIGLLSS